MTFIEKPKRKQAPTRPMQRFWLAGFVFLCAAMIGFMLLTANNDYVSCFDTPFPDLQGVEHHAHFTLPPSAQNVEYAAEGSDTGCMIWVSFDIDPGDLQSLMASSLVTSLESHGNPDSVWLYEMQQQGWQSPKTFLEGFGDLDILTMQSVVIDTTDASRLTVYIIVRKLKAWHGT